MSVAIVAAAAAAAADNSCSPAAMRRCRTPAGPDVSGSSRTEGAADTNSAAGHLPSSTASRSAWTTSVAWQPQPRRR